MTEWQGPNLPNLNEVDFPKNTNRFFTPSTSSGCTAETGTASRQENYPEREDEEPERNLDELPAQLCAEFAQVHWLALALFLEFSHLAVVVLIHLFSSLLHSLIWSNPSPSPPFPLSPPSVKEWDENVVGYRRPHDPANRGAREPDQHLGEVH